jgi:restriction system protein
MRQALFTLLQATGDEAKPTRQILEAFRDALPMVWPLWIVLGVLLGGSLIIGIVKRVLRHRRLSLSGIDDIDEFGGETFEQKLQILFGKLGYNVERTRFRGDYGGDLVMRKDGVRTVVQAKRYTKSVGLRAVQEALGAKAYYECSEAMVVTNSYYTRQAVALARKTNVALWDRDMLIKQLNATGAKNATREDPAATSRPVVPIARPPSTDLPSVETCQQCAKVLTPGERQYCERNARRFDGRMLCFRHQRARS